MALKTIRICDICGTEGEVELDYIVVKLAKSPGGGGPNYLSMTYEVCSDACAKAAPGVWLERNERIERGQVEREQAK